MREMLLVVLATAAPVFSQNPNPKAVALSLNQQALEARSKRTTVEADRLTLEALTAAEKSNDPMLISTCLYNRAMVLQELGRYHEAEPLQRRVVTIMESTHAKPHHLALALQSLASLLFKTHHTAAETEPLLRRAASLAVRNEAPFISALVWNSFGEVLFALGQDREAETCYKRALAANAILQPVSKQDIFQSIMIVGKTKVRLEALILNNQGLIIYRSGQLKQARKGFRSATHVITTRFDGRTSSAHIPNGSYSAYDDHYRATSNVAKYVVYRVVSATWR